MLPELIAAKVKVTRHRGGLYGGGGGTGDRGNASPYCRQSCSRSSSQFSVSVSASGPVPVSVWFWFWPVPPFVFPMTARAEVVAPHSLVVVRDSVWAWEFSVSVARTIMAKKIIRL